MSDLPLMYAGAVGRRWGHFASQPWALVLAAARKQLEKERGGKKKKLGRIGRERGVEGGGGGGEGVAWVDCDYTNFRVRR